MSEKLIVGDVPADTLGTLIDLLVKMKSGAISLERVKRFVKEEEKSNLGIPIWLDEILDKEREYHKAFFNQEFDLTDFQNTLLKYGRKTVKYWKKLGFKPCFLPHVSMELADNYPGWKVKPIGFYYNSILQRRILVDKNRELSPVKKVELEGITVLADMRLKPMYDNGKQLWQDDYWLGSVIKRLRAQGKIRKYDSGPQFSRFGASADEIEKFIKPESEIARKLKVPAESIRLERTIEANAISQIYADTPRKNDGQTNTSVWYDEYFEGRDARLFGGNSADGGLARVSYAYQAGYHWYYWSFRLLAVL